MVKTNTNSKENLITTNQTNPNINLIQKNTESQNLNLTKNESNKSIDANTPAKSIKQSPAKSEVKSGSEIQSEYENTFESLGEVLKGSRDIFNEPVHITNDKNDSNFKLDYKDSNHDSDVQFDTVDNSDIKITKSSDDPFSTLSFQDNVINNNKNKNKAKQDSRYKMSYDDEDDDDFSDRNHESVHMPLHDDDDDILHENLNQIDHDHNINDNISNDDNIDTQFNKMGSFNKTLKGSDLKAMTSTIKSSNETEGSDSGSEDDCIVSDRKLD